MIHNFPTSDPPKGFTTPSSPPIIALLKMSTIKDADGISEKKKQQETDPSNDTHNPCSRPCHGRVDVQNTTVGWLCSDRRELAYHAEPPIQHTATDLHASCCPVRPPGGVVGGQIGKLRLFLGTISRGSVHYRTKLMVVILIRSIP